MSTVVYNKFNKYNIAPYAANKIGIFNSSGTLVGTASLSSFKPVYRDRLYRFGLVSDVHEQTSQTSENQADFQNALSVFNEKESVEFTCISGDLTQNGMTVDSTEIAQYASIVNEKSPDTPVYTTSGNHDCHGTSGSSTVGLQDYLTTWKAYTNLDITTHALTWSPSNSSFYFTKTLDSGATDYFVFLTEQYYYFTSGTYSDNDITWLTNLLATWGTSARVFIFTHMFFNGRAGNFKNRYESSNLLSGTQLTTLTALCDAYPKTMWFSGHSHWKWKCQGYDAADTTYTGLYCNIWHEQSSDGGWTIHCPSCALPIDSLASTSDSTGWTRESSSNYAYLSSEGAIIDVYENYVDIRGVSFKAYNDTSDYDSTYNLTYLPIATYRIPIPSSAGSEEITTFTITLANSSSDVVLSNTATTIKYGASYTTDITGATGLKVTGVTATMGSTDLSSCISNVDTTYILTIDSVIDNITITATYEEEEGTETITSTEYVKVRSGKANATTYTAPVSFTTSGSDTVVTIDVTAVSEGWVFTDTDNTTLNSGSATSMRISCSAIQVYKVYLDSNGNEVEDEITDLTTVKNLGFYDSDQFTDNNSYSIQLPITTTYQLSEAYTCYDYDASVEPNYSTSITCYGIQFNSSSKFTQANNTDWWDSTLSLCGNSSISTTLMKVRVKITNLRIAVS